MKYSKNPIDTSKTTPEPSYTCYKLQFVVVEYSELGKFVTL